MLYFQSDLFEVRNLIHFYSLFLDWNGQTRLQAHSGKGFDQSILFLGVFFFNFCSSINCMSCEAFFSHLFLNQCAALFDA